MSLNNICNVANMSISEKLEANLIGLFDWGFVDNGGYINIDVNQVQKIGFMNQMCQVYQFLLFHPLFMLTDL